MILQLVLKWGMIALLGLTLSSCLKTRSEVGEDDQSQIYQRKNADNQRTAQESQINGKSQAVNNVDERDELIRTLNGRVEGLENQISTLNKQKTEMSTADAQKTQALQEALTKMEAQIQKLESEQAILTAATQRNETVTRPSGARVAGSDKNEPVRNSGNAAKSGDAYEVAQDHFMKKEWKKAIFNYQKYADEAPKGKNIADSKYKIGVCFQELGMKEEAMAFYEEAIANYGKTEAGKKAKMRLAKLKK